MAEDCIFCKIIKGEIPAEFVYQGDRIVAFKDISPQAPVHILIVPKEHVPTINDLEDYHSELIGEMVLVAKGLAKELGISKSGYRLIFNVEKGGGQLIFHIHMHMMGGWE